MTKFNMGMIEFSINRFPYQIMHLSASASLDEQGNEISKTPERWVLKPFGLGSYIVDSDEVANILTLLSKVEQKKSELVDAESELSTYLLEVSEGSRWEESEKERVLRQEKAALIDDLRKAPKDKDRLNVIEKLLKEVE